VLLQIKEGKNMKIEITEKEFVEIKTALEQHKIECEKAIEFNKASDAIDRDYYVFCGYDKKAYRDVFMEEIIKNLGNKIHEIDLLQEKLNKCME